MTDQESMPENLNQSDSETSGEMDSSYIQLTLQAVFKKQIRRSPVLRILGVKHTPPAGHI